LSLSSPSVCVSAFLGVPLGVDVRTMVVLEAKGELISDESISDEANGVKLSGPGVDVLLVGVGSRS
jgi:hypothetical protein